MSKKARIRTNLSLGEMEAVGKKLQLLAKGQRDKSLPLENPAEKELMRRADHLLDVMLESFQQEVTKILLDK